MQRYSLIESYLEKALPKNLSAKQKQRLREELEGHIFDKVDFYVEIGYNETASVKKAVEEMGEAEPVCQEFDRIYKTKPHVFFILCVFFMTASIILYFSLASLTLATLEFEGLFPLLFSAEISLLMTLVFALSTVLSYLRITFEKELRKNVFKIIACILTFTIAFLAYGFVDLYNYYEPIEYEENPAEYAQVYFPFHDISDDKNEYAEIEVSHFPGTDLIDISAMGNFSTDCSINYNVRYFETHSFFLNRKFSYETRYSEQFFYTHNGYISEGEKCELEGVTYTPYIAEDFYGIMISDTFHTYFISATGAVQYDITFDEFKQTAIKQYQNVRKAAKERVFLTIPFDEQIQYVLSYL